MGSKQKVTVTTLPGAAMKIVVLYPDKSKKTHTGTADTGVLAWSYKQPSGKTTASSSTATVTDLSGSLKASKKYTIA